MKTYRNYYEARAEAGDQPILHVGDLYLTGIDENTSVDLISGAGMTGARIILAHLDRIGNANYAKPHPDWRSIVRAFPYCWSHKMGESNKE